jgi:hypothetical protein
MVIDIFTTSEGEADGLGAPPCNKTRVASDGTPPRDPRIFANPEDFLKAQREYKAKSARRQAPAPREVVEISSDVPVSSSPPSDLKRRRDALEEPDAYLPDLDEISREIKQRKVADTRSALGSHTTSSSQ